MCEQATSRGMLATWYYCWSEPKEKDRKYPSAPPVLQSAIVLANWKSHLQAAAYKVCSLPERNWEIWIFASFLCAEPCGDSCSECLLAIGLWDL